MSNQLVLIVGGSGGIGQQFAKDYSSLGNRVIITGLDAQQLQDVYEQLYLISSNCYRIQCDLADTESVNKMATHVLKEYGCPDILINCAGYATYRTFEESSWEEIENLVQVNLLGSMRCVKAFLPAMIARKQGVIVNIASIAGRMVLTPNGTYSAAKHGMVAWSEVLQYELARFGIHIHVICPGRVETGFFDHETFKNRLPRPESRYTITTQQISRATMAAIKNNCFLTDIPWTFTLMVWGMNVIPWILMPFYRHLVRRRIETYYSNNNK